MNQKFKTSTKVNTTNPCWEEGFIVPFHKSKVSLLLVELFDRNPQSQDPDYVGSLFIDTNQLQPGVSDGWYSLSNMGGMLRIRLQQIANQGV